MLAGGGGQSRREYCGRGARLGPPFHGGRGVAAKEVGLGGSWTLTALWTNTCENITFRYVPLHTWIVRKQHETICC